MIVSIIIPVHKTTTFLLQCVNSAINQTYKNIEILIVCNGNLTVKECDSFLNISDPRVQYLTSEKGRHKARNKGIEISKGDYLQFLDYDDLLSEEKIEKQIKVIEKCKKQNAISISKWNIFTDTTHISKTLNLEYLFNKNELSGLELYQLLGKNKGYIMTASWLFPKAIINNVQWEDVPNDDALFASEVINEKTVILPVPYMLTSYRDHSDNTRTIRTTTELDKLIYSWKKIRRNLKNLNHFLVSCYYYNAYFYMLKYSVNCKGHRFFSLLWNFNLLGISAKVPFQTLMEKNMVLLKKTTGLVSKKVNK